MITKTLYLTFGFLFLVLAIIGVVLPIFPTVPFLIAASFCFSRSSKSLHKKLLNTPVFGNLLHQWEAHGVIEFHIKIIATLAMIVMIIFALFFYTMAVWIRILIIIIIIFVLTYIWSRPSQPEQP
jgi:uncharacterized membrane protein YbaN (DUF454 family)